jgi:ribonuclease PH
VALSVLAGLQAVGAGAEVDMNPVKLDQTLVEVQGTGKKGTFTRAKLLELLDAADAGIEEIFAAQHTALDL